MRAKIFYFHGVFGDRQLLSESEPVVQKLLDGDYQAADLDLKKVSSSTGHRYLTVKLNDADRLLFTIINVLGKQYLLLLERILNHDYQKSRFLKPGVLTNYLLSSSAEIAKQIIIEESLLTEEEFAELIPISSKDPLHFSNITFYNKEFMEANAKQAEIPETALPLVVDGPPGSGKTFSALMVIMQLVERAQYSGLPVLYVTKSPFLVLKMLENIQALPEAQMLDLSLIRTLTNEQLVIELDGIKDFEKKKADFKHFDFWIRKQQFEKVLKGGRYYTRKLYQEFRILSGLDSLLAYQGLGARQCIYPKEEREAVYELYLNYINHLNDAELLDLAFYKLKSSFQFEAVVVDEAQDFSHLESKNLYNLALNAQIIYYIDPHQSLFDEKSKRLFLLNLIQQISHKSGEYFIQLEGSYRCMPNILKFAERALSLKLLLTKGLSDKYERSQIDYVAAHEEKGRVCWLNEIGPKEEELFLRLSQSTSFAVVTSLEYKEEAEKRFGTKLIFTPEEIKGLEYETILIYHPFADEIFIKANTILGEEFQLSAPEHRAKKGKAREEFGPPLNEFFMAISRAVKACIVFEPAAHPLKNLIHFMQVVVEPGQELHTFAVDLKTTTKESWEKEQKLQEELGNHEQAAKIEADLAQIALTPKVHQEETKPNLKTEPPVKITEVKAPIHEKSGGKRGRGGKVLAARASEVREQRPVQKQETPAQKIERLDKLWNNFSQSNLLALFKAPDGMHLLFEIPTRAQPSFFAACIAEKGAAKQKTLNKFFKEQGKIAAEKITPVLLAGTTIIQTRPESKMLLNPTPLRVKVSILFYLYHNKFQWLLHQLFHQYSPLQRIRFLIEVYFDTTAIHDVLSDPMITQLLNFKDRIIKEHGASFIGLLSDFSSQHQVPFFLPLTTFAFGIEFLKKMLVHKEFRALMETNIYTIHHNTPHPRSLLYNFSLKEQGIAFLTDLFNQNKALAEKLSLEDLTKRNGAEDGSVLDGLIELNGAKGHDFLLSIIRKDLAAYLPILEEHWIYLFSSSSGLDFINQLLDAQPNLIHTLNGSFIFKYFHVELKKSIWPNLYSSVKGIALFDRLLTVHQSSFVRQMIGELTAGYFSRSELAQLEKSKEGQALLKRIVEHGWRLSRIYADKLGKEPQDWCKEMAKAIEENTKISSFLVAQSTKYLPSTSQAAFFSVSKEHYKKSQDLRAQSAEFSPSKLV